jgi:hypothetical protein
VSRGNYLLGREVIWRRSEGELSEKRIGTNKGEKRGKRWEKRVL